MAGIYSDCSTREIIITTSLCQSFSFTRLFLNLFLVPSWGGGSAARREELVHTVLLTAAAARSGLVWSDVSLCPVNALFCATASSVHISQLLRVTVF